MAIRVEDLTEIFTYHAPSAEQQQAYKHIREAAQEFAFVVLSYTPVSADQTAAVRKIREAVMTANAAVALGGKF